MKNARVFLRVLTLLVLALFATELLYAYLTSACGQAPWIAFGNYKSFTEIEASAKRYIECIRGSETYRVNQELRELYEKRYREEMARVQRHFMEKQREAAQSLSGSSSSGKTLLTWNDPEIDFAGHSDRLRLRKNQRPPGNSSIL